MEEKQESRNLNPSGADEYEDISSCSADFSASDETAEENATGDMLSLDELLSAVPEKTQTTNEKNYADMKKKKKKSKHTGTVKGIIWIVVIVTVSLFAAYGIIRVVSDFLGIGFSLKTGFGKPKTDPVEITEGMTATQIADLLQEKDVIDSALAFRLYAKFNHFDNQFKSGIYEFKPDYGYADIANVLINEGLKATEVTVKIDAGSSLNEIAQLLEENHVCRAEDFLSLTNGNFNSGIERLNSTYQKKFTYKDFDYDFIKEIPVTTHRLQGYLLPDTYRFYAHNEADYTEMPNSVDFAYWAADKMLSNFNTSAAAQLQKRADSSDYTFHQLVTMGSMIQAEAGNAAQKDKEQVARVFCNRLEGVNWEGPKKLQSDPTVTYANEHNDERFDTYEREGLPPAPMGATNADCLLAAANPTPNSKATYFVSDKNGAFYFSESLSQHNTTIASLKSKGLWLYTTF